jgi:hypothetical protein
MFRDKVVGLTATALIVGEAVTVTLEVALMFAFAHATPVTTSLPAVAGAV